jgi:hypothetical protein
MTPPRHQTQTERDLAGMAAKKEREREDSSPEYVEEDDDYTGKFSTDPEKLSRLRSNRPTPERISKLERKNDLLVEELIKGNKWRREIMMKIVAGFIALATAYLLGKHT